MQTQNTYKVLHVERVAIYTTLYSFDKESREKKNKKFVTTYTLLTTGDSIEKIEVDHFSFTILIFL